MPGNLTSVFNTSPKVARALEVCSRLDVLADAIY